MLKLINCDLIGYFSVVHTCPFFDLTSLSVTDKCCHFNAPFFMLAFPFSLMPRLLFRFSSAFEPLFNCCTPLPPPINHVALAKTMKGKAQAKTKTKTQTFYSHCQIYSTQSLWLRLAACSCSYFCLRRKGVVRAGGAIPECGLQRAASGKSLRVSTPGERPGELCRRALLSATCCPL